ncbi:MAG TPA: hypothetical protein VLV46_11075 [Gaiellaceae bacterium]|nr:hypothetical protein [Gaiellaceae bacterium]
MPQAPVARSGVAAALVALLGALGLLAAGCGNGKTTTTTNAQGQTVVSCQIAFAKTKFLLHTGIAAGAFYRYIYDPWRAGAFKKGAPGRAKALAKAAASGVVVVHELKIAARDAQCDGPALKALARPMTAAVGAAGALTSPASLTGGLGSIGTAGAAFDDLKSAAAAAGVSIKQR